MQNATEAIFALTQQNSQTLAEIKRFKERWDGDKLFRDLLHNDPSATISEYGFNINPSTVEYIWNNSLDYETYFNTRDQESESINQMLKELVDLLHAEEQPIAAHEAIMDQGISNSRFKHWRSRQKNRLISQTVRGLSKDSGHFLAAFELSKGCSGGCWFCSLSAERLESVYLHNPDTQKEWKFILEELKTLLGPALHTSFCYWATDPLDNPDYESFALDFKDILGSFPSTTTALATRDVTRTRDLLGLTRSENGSTRFSVTSKAKLDEIHKAFTSTELLHTELVLQMDGAIYEGKSNAGRARERALVNSKRASVVDDDQSPSCVSGFLFNMVEKTITLISPCLPCDLWPNGHRTHAEHTFNDYKDVPAIIEEMINKHMPEGLNRSMPINLRSDIKISDKTNNTTGDLVLETHCKSIYFHKVSNPEAIAQLLERGDKTPNQIEYIMSRVFHSSLQATNDLLVKLYDYGMIEDDPKLLNNTETNRTSSAICS